MVARRPARARPPIAHRDVKPEKNLDVRQATDNNGGIMSDEKKGTPCGERFHNGREYMRCISDAPHDGAEHSAETAELLMQRGLRAFTLRRSATIPNPWLVRFKNESGQLVEHSTGEVDRATAERVAEKIHRRAREMERAESERISARVALGEDVTAGSILREHVAERTITERGLVNPTGDVPRVIASFVSSAGKQHDLVAQSRDDNKKWETSPDDRPRHHEGAILSPSTHEDTNLISQGGGWSTFKREGEWWCERSRGSGRVEFTLSTRDDGVSGERFFHLQNEFRDTPLNELLLKTYALRAGWARVKAPFVEMKDMEVLSVSVVGEDQLVDPLTRIRPRMSEVIARVAEEDSELLGALAEQEKKTGAGTWLGVPLEDGANKGPLELKRDGGYWWTLWVDGKHPVLVGKSEEIDALTRAWIKSIATLVPTLTIVSTIEASGGYEATLSDGTILKSPDGVAWRRGE